jgi:hypothetical protein
MAGYDGLGYTAGIERLCQAHEKPFRAAAARTSKGLDDPHACP